MLIFRRKILLVQHLVLSLSLGDCSVHRLPMACPGILFERGVQQIQLRTEDRDNGDLGQ